MVCSKIKGTGRYVPERVVTNHDLTKIMDTSDEWIVQRTGIEKRHWVPEEGGVGPSDLGLEASKIAMKKAGWEPGDLDFIIFATLSPDIYFPGSGCLLQTKMGLESIPALDIRQQCTGFIYAMATADSYIKSGLAKKILVVGAEVHSTGLDKTTRGRDVAVIFGDGAGAVCVEAEDCDDASGVLASSLHADGKYARSLMAEMPSTLMNPCFEKTAMEQGRHYPVMDGSRIFKLAVRKLPEVTMETIMKAGVELSEIDLIIPHQANLRINQFYQKALELPDDKIYNNIQNYGNTTAASIPMALDEVLEKNLLGKKNDLVMFVALGAGVTWGSLLYKF